MITNGNMRSGANFPLRLDMSSLPFLELEDTVFVILCYIFLFVIHEM